MPLTPGTRIGAYQIAAQIGVGGMGEVYRATDRNLKRSVAIKVLPAPAAGDAERLARFQREAEVLAALNHPNIAQIFGLEKTPAFTALVMELVEGDDLSQRIARGAIPLDDALPIAKQIAAALEAAHEQGIIHRDLKPANIKLRSDGTVKVLDFGLAKVFDPTARRSDATASSTMEMTRAGVILGTAAYMSPEQAKGHEVDKRSDVWSFGCVLYEMLSGHRPFRADNVADLVAAVLTKEPDWDALPATAPASIRRLIHRCLEKDPRRRLRDIGDARLELDEATSGSTPIPSGAPPSIERQTRRERVAWILVALLSLSLIATVVIARLARSAPPASAISRTTIILPAGQELDVDLRAAPLALSPDGIRLAYVAEADGRKQLYFRKLADLEATPVPGTAGATHPFFSPDGAWVAFFARGLLQKVSISGGAPLPICPVSGMTMGGSWGSGDWIVFATLDAGLLKVRAGGGEPQRLAGSEGATWPEILPDGKTVLFVWNLGVPGSSVKAMSIDGGTVRVLARDDLDEQDSTAPMLGAGQFGPVRYVSTGYLVFGQGAFHARALAFDRETLTFKGSPVPVVDSVFRSANSGPLYFTVSRTGLLVYAPEDPRRQLMWVARDGRATAVATDQEAFRYPSISPDGRRLAVDINTEERRSDLWVYNTEREARTRLTNERSSILPVWTPDGLRVTFSAASALLERRSEGSGPQDVLLKYVGRENQPAPNYPTSWSPDGRDLLFTADQPATGKDLWVLTRGSDKPRALLVRPFNDAWAAFSKDGHWIAFLSDESGTNEMYVAHYPDMEQRMVVSTHGAGWKPVWSPDGHELFYRQGNAVMAVPVTTTPTLRIGMARQLFTGPYVGVDGDRMFDIAPDGKRFLMTARVDADISRRLIVVQNLFDELKRQTPAAR